MFLSYLFFKITQIQLFRKLDNYTTVCKTPALHEWVETIKLFSFKALNMSEQSISNFYVPTSLLTSKL